MDDKRRAGLIPPCMCMRLPLTEKAAACTLPPVTGGVKSKSLHTDPRELQWALVR